MLHVEQPNGVGAFVRGGIAFEVAHFLIEKAFRVFCGGQKSRRLTLGELERRGIELMRWGRDRFVNSQRAVWGYRRGGM
jgi:hypothetical protein